MTTRYWQGIGATAINASVGSNWGTTTTGSTGVAPSSTDTIIFGHSETIAAGKGMAPCNFNIASLSLAEIRVLEGYRYTVSNSGATVGTSFIAATDIFTSPDADFIVDGFKVGMVVNVTGSKTSNGTYTLAAVTATTLDLTTGISTDETIAADAEYTITVTAAPSYLQIAEGITTNGLYLNGTIAPDASARTISFAGSYLGTSPTPDTEYLERYILNGDNANILNPAGLRYNINQTANGSTACHFDDGPYPIVSSDSASKFSPQYIPPIGNSGSTDFYSFLLTNSNTVQFQPLNTVNNAAGDASKVFKITSFAAPNLQFTGAVFDTGLSTFHITANDRFLPTTGNITDFGGTNSSFFAKINNLVIEPGSTGAKYAGVRGRTTLTSANLTVKANATLRGTGVDGDNSSMITCLGHPQVEGTWNFYQLAPGIYSSNPWRTMPAVANGGTGLSDIPAGHIPYGETNLKMDTDANLTFASDTLHADRGIKLTEGSDHPIAYATGTGIVWVKNTAPSTLIFTNDVGTDTTLGAGGGGGVSSVATTAPITGGTITGTGTIALNISGLTANTAIADADLLLIDDGANGTNRKTTFTEVKEWIRGDSVALGVTGGVNQLKIRDARADGELNPDAWGEGQVSFDFTDDIAGSTNTYDGVITMKGWSDSYRVSQLFSSAASEGTSSTLKNTEPLYFRSGEDTGWGTIREVLTFPGTTPNADGTAGQVLQTDGSGALTWVTRHGKQTVSASGAPFDDTPTLEDALGNALIVLGWCIIEVGGVDLCLPAYGLRT